LSWTQVDGNAQNLLLVKTDPAGDGGKIERICEVGKDFLRSRSEGGVELDVVGWGHVGGYS
jgi:hypothetical protein